MADQLALTKSSQKKFAKQVNKVKNELKTSDAHKERTTKTARRRNRGIIYVGHIPHGFYEEEMRQYFSQFGKVTNVSVARSKKTGRSKGYGFIEFAHEEVAKIAAESTHNYLMFKRRLVAEYISPEKKRHFTFSKNPVSETNIPGVIRRQKEVAKKNTDHTPMTETKQCRKKLAKLKTKLNRLKRLGIDHFVEPLDVPETFLNETFNKHKEEATYEEIDSDVEVKVKPKNVRTSLK